MDDEKIREGATLKIHPTTRDKLKAIGQKGETYDQIINLLLFVYKRASEVYTDEDYPDTIRLDAERAGAI